MNHLLKCILQTACAALNKHWDQFLEFTLLQGRLAAQLQPVDQVRFASSWVSMHKSQNFARGSLKEHVEYLLFSKTLLGPIITRMFNRRVARKKVMRLRRVYFPNRSDNFAHNIAFPTWLSKLTCRHRRTIRTNQS